LNVSSGQLPREHRPPGSMPEAQGRLFLPRAICHEARNPRDQASCSAAVAGRRNLPDVFPLSMDRVDAGALPPEPLVPQAPPAVFHVPAAFRAPRKPMAAEPVRPGLGAIAPHPPERPPSPAASRTTGWRVSPWPDGRRQASRAPASLPRPWRVKPAHPPMEVLPRAPPWPRRPCTRRGAAWPPRPEASSHGRQAPGSGPGGSPGSHPRGRGRAGRAP
jgi:hypothetical protein